MRPVRRTHASIVAATLTVATLAVSSPVAALDEPPSPAIDTSPEGWPAAPPIDAETYVLVEAETGQVLAEHRSHERRPVASTIKILTALTAVERADIATDVTVGAEVEDVGGASVGLEPGDTWTVEELLTAVLARSGNEAAQALAVHVAGSVDAFLELMREDLASVGIHDVVLSDVSGLDDGNLLSALDLATLTRVAMEDIALRRIVAVPIVTLPEVGAIESRNELLSTYPDATGVKTGYTAAAGNSLVASAMRGDRELIAVVLGSGDDPARFDAAAELLDHGFDRFLTTRLTATVTFVLAGGQVELVVDPVTISIPGELDAQLRLPVQARPPTGSVAVPIEVDGRAIAEVAGRLERSATDVDRPAAALGRGAVDGAYAALRAGAASGSLR